MTIKTEILTSFYQDSVILMRIAGQIRTRSGVREFAAFMGTPSNHALLEQIGMTTDEGRSAEANDLILTVDAENEKEAEAALTAAKERLMARRQAIEESGEFRPRTLDTALRHMPGANLVTISVPGTYAKFETMRALRRELHVFLFSDNVSLEEEIELKQEALKRQLLCMGPDQGTAYLNGIGLGFANRVSRGRIGCVAASGTGLQAVVSRLAALGEGISHGIGVGGRDLSKEVAGMMTLFAIEALASDLGTEAVVLISKPPHPAILPKLEDALEKTDKPTVACCIGASETKGSRTTWVKTLDGAADAVIAKLNNKEWSPAYFSDPEGVQTRLGRVQKRHLPKGSGILGLFTGGTLAYETQFLIEPLLGPVRLNQDIDTSDHPHWIVDLGDDVYTVGRPHPMIDPQVRTEMISEAGLKSDVGVLLLDLVLGKGSHPEPAKLLVDAYKNARCAAEADGRQLLAVASVIGTASDPQSIARQTAQLEAAGVEVLPTNAEAAYFATLLIKPELTHKLLENKR